MSFLLRDALGFLFFFDAFGFSLGFGFGFSLGFGFDFSFSFCFFVSYPSSFNFFLNSFKFGFFRDTLLFFCDAVGFGYGISFSLGFGIS